MSYLSIALLHLEKALVLKIPRHTKSSMFLMLRIRNIFVLLLPCFFYMIGHFVYGCFISVTLVYIKSTSRLYQNILGVELMHVKPTYMELICMSFTLVGPICMSLTPGVFWCKVDVNRCDEQKSLPFCVCLLVICLFLQTSNFSVYENFRRLSCVNETYFVNRI